MLNFKRFIKQFFFKKNLPFPKLGETTNYKLSSKLQTNKKKLPIVQISFASSTHLLLRYIVVILLVCFLMRRFNAALVHFSKYLELYSHSIQQFKQTKDCTFHVLTVIILSTFRLGTQCYASILKC